jgi:hypothetical protein
MVGMNVKNLPKWIGILIAASGCTAALDFDSLQSGLKPSEPTETDDTDSSGLAIPCEGDSDCNDDIECTLDKCGSAGFCTESPSNASCPGFEVCRVGEGCVDIGRECLTESDCDDGIECTRNACSSDGKCTLLLVDDDLCKDPEDLCLQGAVCDETQGCIGGFEKPCDQVEGPYCYNYFCAPSTGKCDDVEFKPGADKDGDGYCSADAAFGGDDCNDSDDAVNPGASEMTDNQADDDCDGETDETDAL